MTNTTTVIEFNHIEFAEQVMELNYTGMTRIALAKLYVNNSRLKGILADGLKFKEEVSRIKKYLESNKKQDDKIAHRFAAYKAAREYLHTRHNYSLHDVA
jgi:hypothetical protein